MVRISRVGAGLLLACVLAVGQGQAVAAESPDLASASVGRVNMIVGGVAIHTMPIADCATGATTDAMTLGVNAGTTTSYGLSESHCTRGSDGMASARMSGTRFETTVLARYGGPVIEVRTFGARCETTANGSRSYVSLGGVQGISIPQTIPANYTITVEGTEQQNRPVARIVLNELVAPTPPDGSLTVHTMRIELFPEGGPASGEIIVGTASCDPYPG